MNPEIWAVSKSDLFMKDPSGRDARDGQVGVVGYEINFNRYFYRYDPPRALEEIDSDIREIEEEIVRMLGEVTAPASAH